MVAVLELPAAIDTLSDAALRLKKLLPTTMDPAPAPEA